MLFLPGYALIAATEPSSKGHDIVSAVSAAIANARSEQASLPPAKNDAERIIRLGIIDEAPRKIVTNTDFSILPDAERSSTISRISKIVDTSDVANEQALLRLVPKEGWFRRSRYGDDASTAAFLIIQHSNLELQTRFLPIIGKYAAAGEADGQLYGTMFDRVAVGEGRPQRYGTQFRCDGSKWRPYPIENIGEIELFRASLHFTWTYAQGKAYFDKAPSCPQTASPPPAGMNLQ